MSEIFQTQQDIFWDIWNKLNADRTGTILYSFGGGVVDFVVNKLPLKPFLNSFGLGGKIAGAFVEGQLNFLNFVYFSYTTKVLDKSLDISALGATSGLEAVKKST